jgi:hypothetical protein
MSSQYIDLPVEAGGSAGVSSLNSITGAVVLVAGSGITLTPSGQDITIASTGGGSGTVTSVSVASANGFAGSVANPTTTPAITISTSITGLLKGNGTAISAATAGTDYVIPSVVTLSSLSILGSQVSSAVANATTAVNITASSNSTLTTLSALSLPYSQITGAPAAGITQLTGDATAGPGSGSQALTLATVNSNTGSFGSASSVATFTVNAKGLLTAAGSTAIAISGSAVSGGTFGAVNGSALTNLSAAALSGVLPVGVTGGSGLSIATSQLTGTLQAAQFPALTGDVTTTAGSFATALVATSNSTLVTLSALSLPYSQVTGTPAAITALTGQVTASGPGSATATIATNTVTNSNLAQMATNTIKGNNTGGTANAADLTESQINTMMSGYIAMYAAFGF